MKAKILIVVSIGLFFMCFACNKENANIPDGDAPIPVIGHSFKADFGDFVFRIDFMSETQLKFTTIKGDSIGYVETVQITRKEIRPNVFLVYWQEVSKTTVSHIEDFTNGIVYTNITLPDNTFRNLKGTLTLIE